VAEFGDGVWLRSEDGVVVVVVREGREDRLESGLVLANFVGVSIVSVASVRRSSVVLCSRVVDVESP